ncbi:phosphate ABC transporter permease [Natronomonas sp. LN261]|uniref:phosphate ABC transporter permease n=1 Tax=Natronomonas sp. LN261 TaxID=2750669 RepID=UPI0015EE843C|nr:phosphate ABC transporter permease [Natronomonas sp. LN261]
MELVDVGLLLAGFVLVFFGAALSVYAAALLGFLIGAGGGYVLAPQLFGALGTGGVVGLAVAVVVGGALGAALAYVALSVATAIPSFVVGAYIGLYVITPIFTEGGLVRYLVMIVAGVVGAFVGFTLTKFALMFVTAFVGAAFASGSIAAADLTAVRDGFSPDPILFDPLATTPVAGVELPAFGALFVLGLLTQIGLFRLGWVTRLAAVVPGIGRVLGNGE